MSKKKEQAQPPVSKTYNIGKAGIVVADHSQATISHTQASGGDMAIGGAVDVKALAEAFEKITQAVNAMPDGPNKGIAQNAVQGIKEEADKGDKADKSKVEQWFNFLAQVGPAAFKVAVDTFVNPIKGLSTAFQEIAAYAKQQKKS
jgi:hypothetical protein